MLTAITEIGSVAAIVYGEFGCSVSAPEELTVYALIVLSLCGGLQLVTQSSKLLVTYRYSCAVEEPGGVKVIAESALGTFVSGSVVTRLKLGDPGEVLNTSSCGASVITNKRLPPASRVMAIAVSPPVRVAAVVGAERLPSDPTV